MFELSEPARRLVALLAVAPKDDAIRTAEFAMGLAEHLADTLGLVRHRLVEATDGSAPMDVPACWALLNLLDRSAQQLQDCWTREAL